MTRQRIVAALGGNALLRRGEPLEAELQRANVKKAAAALAAVAESHELVVTHGNGPQIGLLALQAAALSGIEPYPLDVLGAESEGMIGYLLEQELRNALPGRDVATLLTKLSSIPRTRHSPTHEADWAGLHRGGCPPPRGGARMEDRA